MANLRFYCSNPLVIGESIQFSESAAAHATKALRLDVGDHATVFNGDGSDYSCILTSIKKNTVTAQLTSARKLSNESPISIALLQAISSGDRMDYTIQKAVELGVTSIQPISSQRSVVKLSAERAEKRTEHWRSIVTSACEQSGRAYVPTVYAPINFGQLFADKNKMPSSNACKITLAPDATENLSQLTKPNTNIYLLIGAEGGLTDEEISLSKLHGFQTIKLGERVLRTETAALAAISALQTLWGDFN